MTLEKSYLPGLASIVSTRGLAKASPTIVTVVALYLSIAEMEFYPMEVLMFGNMSDDSLIINNFEILYIQGCDEQ